MKLRVWYHNQPVATLAEGVAGSIQLTYEESWLAQSGAFPISHSLPLQTETFTDSRPVLWFSNLLPENWSFLHNLAHEFGVDKPLTPFSILAKVGADLPGALGVLPMGEQPDTRALLEQVAPAEIAEDLQRLRKFAPARQQRLSLAGAQPKTALYCSPLGGWFRPGYAAASTHILKPALQDLSGLEWVELVLQKTAAKVGIDAAESSVADFGGELAFVSTRFDRRMEANGMVTRLQTEDLVQFLGMSHTRKYQQDNGPGVRELITAVRQVDPESESEVWRRLAFNVAVGNTDAHGKNFSFFISSEGFTLAPAYDLISIIPYSGYTPNLAMGIGKQYHYQQVKSHDWEYVAKRCGGNPQEVAAIVAEVTELVPAALTDTLHEVNVDHPALVTLAEYVTR